MQWKTIGNFLVNTKEKITKQLSYLLQDNHFLNYLILRQTGVFNYLYFIRFLVMKYINFNSELK